MRKLWCLCVFVNFSKSLVSQIPFGVEAFQGIGRLGDAEAAMEDDFLRAALPFGQRRKVSLPIRSFFSFVNWRMMELLGTQASPLCYGTQQQGFVNKQ